MATKSELKGGFIGHPEAESLPQMLNRQQRRTKKRNFLQEINRLGQGEKHGH